jgi:hypothetical protein
MPHSSRDHRWQDVTVALGLKVKEEGTLDPRGSSLERAMWQEPPAVLCQAIQPTCTAGVCLPRSVVPVHCCLSEVSWFRQQVV